MKKRLYSFLLISLIMLMLVPTVLAQEERSDAVVVVEQDEVLDDDLYASGESVVIDGTITGDLISFSSDTTINGTVEGDILFIGQTLTVNGEVGGSVRGSGMSTLLSAEAHVGKDIFFAGYSLTTAAGSVVEGDVRFFGGQAVLNGDVGGDVVAAGNGVAINGDVGGDVEANVGAEVGEQAFGFSQFMQYIPDAPEMVAMVGGIQMGEEVQIDGQVSVTAPETANLAPIREQFPDAEIEETAVVQTQGPNPWISAFTRLVSLLLVGALVAGVKPDLIVTLSGYLQEKPLPSFGWGLLVYFLFPVGMIVLTVAILVLGGFFGLLSLDLIRNTIFLVGVTILAVLLVSMILIMIFLTKIMIGYLIGRFIFNKVKPELNEKAIWPVLLGLLVVVILISLPYIGWLLNMVVMLFGLGALIVMWRIPKSPVEKELAA